MSPAVVRVLSFPLRDYSHGRRAIYPRGIPLCEACLSVHRAFMEEFLPHDYTPFFVEIKYDKESED
jgi:hypothetical protein